MKIFSRYSRPAGNFISDQDRMVAPIRLSVIIAFVVAVTASGFGTTLHFARQSVKETTAADMEFASSIAANLVSGEVSRLFENTSRAARIFRETDPPPEKAPEMLKALCEQFDLASLALFDADGVVARYGEHAPDGDFRSSESVAAALRGTANISSLQTAANGDPVFRIHVPAPDGRAMLSSVPGTWFAGITGQLRSSRKHHLFILDRNGVPVAGMDGADAGTAAGIRQNFAADPQNGWHDLPEKTDFCFYRPISGTDGWTLAVAGALPRNLPVYRWLAGLAVVVLGIGSGAAAFATWRIGRVSRGFTRKRKQLESVAEISGLTYWEWDCANDKVVFSSHFTSEYGYLPAEVTAVGFPRRRGVKHRGLTFRQIAHPEDAEYVADTLTNCLTGKKDCIQMELRVRHKNGGYLWSLVAGHVAERNGARPTLLIGGLLNVNDIRQAERLSKAKSDFLATVSHEIRTPLNTILGISEIQMQKPLPEATYTDIEKIYYAGASLLGIINDMLDLSKVEAGGFSLVSDEYNVAHLINDIVQLNIVRIGSKPITFMLDIVDHIPARLRGDELRIKQILNNLLSNAFKYTKEGQVRLDIGWEETDTGSWLVFSVSDTGIGIRQKDIEKIFLAYTQLDIKANRAIEGTGLGLFITKKLVDMMDGELSVTSEYGKGSVFRAKLRQIKVDSLPISPQKIEDLKALHFLTTRRIRGKNIARAYMPYGKVLVVDDVMTNLDVAKGLLLPYGLTVDCVTNGPEAIERVRSAKTRYDVVFMDHMMPHMDGLEATRIIRHEIDSEYARTVPIIALTANAMVGNEEMFIQNGFNGFIAKPIDLMRMDTVLNKWIRDKQSKETLWLSDTAPESRDAAGSLRKPSFLPDIPVDGLDVKTGVERCGGEEPYLQILRSYARHTPELLDRMRDLREESLPDYTVTVHGLKGSSYSVCAADLADRAETLEKAARAGDFMTVREINPSLLEAAEKLLADIGGLLAAVPEHGEPKNLRPSPDRELLLKMREAGRQFENTGMEKIMAELELFRYESGGELVVWLREQMDSLEYEAIVNRLEEL